MGKTEQATDRFDDGQEPHHGRIKQAEGLKEGEFSIHSGRKMSLNRSV